MSHKKKRRREQEPPDHQPLLRQPVAAREHDGGEGVIVARGGAETGNAARDVAEDAADTDDLPQSGDGA